VLACEGGIHEWVGFRGDGWICYVFVPAGVSVEFGFSSNLEPIPARSPTHIFLEGEGGVSNPSVILSYIPKEVVRSAPVHDLVPVVSRSTWQYLSCDFDFDFDSDIQVD
jgi:hypothetical protein